MVIQFVERRGREERQRQEKEAREKEQLYRQFSSRLTTIKRQN